MGSEEEEERVVLVFPDPFLGFFNPFVGQVLVPKAGGVATGVEPDPANPIALVELCPWTNPFSGMAVGHSSGWLGLRFLSDPKGDPWG